MIIHLIYIKFKTLLFGELIMKNMVFVSALVASISAVSVTTYAHEPYIAPLAYVTENTQTPVISGYAEHALNSEYALKDVTFTVIDPAQTVSIIQPESTLKSATVFDLALPTDGTYKISSKVAYPLEYALHNKEWKLFHNVSADKAGAITERDYLIPDDFKKSKAPKLEKVSREWTIESYVTKNKTSTLTNKVDAPLNVTFSVHPNEIKAATPLNIQVQKANHVLKNAQVNILAQGTNEEQALKTLTNTQGIAEVKFPSAGQYLIEVTETVDAKKKPENQYYTIISVSVTP